MSNCVFGLQDRPDALVVGHIKEPRQLGVGEVFLKLGLFLDEVFGEHDLSAEGLDGLEVWVLGKPLEDGLQVTPRLFWVAQSCLLHVHTSACRIVFNSVELQHRTGFYQSLGAKKRTPYLREGKKKRIS